jgi:hypothetical protein
MFVHDANLGFVVVDRLRSSRALVDFAIRALHLQPVEVDGNFELYEPVR